MQEYAGIQTNKKLEQQIDKHTEEEVSEAVDCYLELIDDGKTFSNPQGWLVECLKGQWWTNSPSRQRKRLVEDSILKTLEKYGWTFPNFEQFFSDYWKAEEDQVMYDFDENRWKGGERAGFLMINERGVWVRGLNDHLEEEWQHWNDFVVGL